jgi:hypothetical protein
MLLPLQFGQMVLLALSCKCCITCFMIISLHLLESSDQQLRFFKPRNSSREFKIAASLLVHRVE